MKKVKKETEIEMAGVPGIGNVVASHYNNLEEKGVASRAESRIYHMRNLNNWIKSMLIGHYTEKIRSDAEANGEGRVPLRVLDVGAGKGGDFLKWQKARADHVVCADIAATSLEQAKVRHEDMRRRSRSGHLFSAEFVPADCTKKRLRDLYRDPDQKFDLVSCQFTFHYCFESLPQAECMLRNISENLRYGGFFIGTTPDAYDIVSRLEKSGENKIGNSVYSITRRWPEDAERIPLFGAQVDFHLEGVVDCPEFLVHFPTLEKLAAKYDLVSYLITAGSDKYPTQYGFSASDRTAAFRALL